MIFCSVDSIIPTSRTAMRESYKPLTAPASPQPDHAARRYRPMETFQRQFADVFHHHQFERARALLFLIWCAVPLGALMFLVLIVNARRKNGGSP